MERSTYAILIRHAYASTAPRHQHVREKLPADKRETSQNCRQSHAPCALRREKRLCAWRGRRARCRPCRYTRVYRLLKSERNGPAVRRETRAAKRSLCGRCENAGPARLPIPDSYLIACHSSGECAKSRDGLLLELKSEAGAIRSEVGLIAEIDSFNFPVRKFHDRDDGVECTRILRYLRLDVIASLKRLRLRLALRLVPIRDVDLESDRNFEAIRAKKAGERISCPSRCHDHGAGVSARSGRGAKNATSAAQMAARSVNAAAFVIRNAATFDYSQRPSR